MGGTKPAESLPSMPVALFDLRLNEGLFGKRSTSTRMCYQDLVISLAVGSQNVLVPLRPTQTSRRYLRILSFQISFELLGPTRDIGRSPQESDGYEGGDDWPPSNRFENIPEQKQNRANWAQLKERFPMSSYFEKRRTDPQLQWLLGWKFLLHPAKKDHSNLAKTTGITGCFAFCECSSALRVAWSALRVAWSALRVPSVLLHEGRLLFNWLWRMKDCGRGGGEVIMGRANLGLGADGPRKSIPINQHTCLNKRIVKQDMELCYLK